MSKYKETEQFWDGIFSEEKKDKDISEPISIEEIEEGIKWLSEGSDSIIDFGCGNGSLLLRSGYLSEADMVGIDISEEALRAAEKIAEDNHLDQRSEFLSGGVEKLSRFGEDEFDAGILSNVVDNLIPDDARSLLSEFNRIIESDGKLLLKMNDHTEPEQLEEWGSEEISESFYKEDTGLYFWNLTDKEVDQLLSEYFTVDKRIDVEFKEHDQINRMYYLRN